MNECEIRSLSSNALMHGKEYSDRRQSEGEKRKTLFND